MFERIYPATNRPSDLRFVQIQKVEKASAKRKAPLPNSNYTRGRAREYQVMRNLRANGWVCSRSAMSHGPVDVFAAKAGKVLLIQVKSGSSRVGKEELGLLKSYAVAFNADAEVWSFRKRGKILKLKVSKRMPRRTSIPKEVVPQALETGPIQTIEPLYLPS